jgi:hypothetical protein
MGLFNPLPCRLASRKLPLVAVSGGLGPALPPSLPPAPAPEANPGGEEEGIAPVEPDLE